MSPNPVNSPAINYEQTNKEIAVKSYINYQQKSGNTTWVVHECGLYVDSSIPWLTPTPDGTVEIAILCMHKYVDVRLEDGISQWQWGQKKLCIIQLYEWGGDLELCLLAIGLGEEVVVVTGSDKFTSAQRFFCHLVMHRYQFFY